MLHAEWSKEKRRTRRKAARNQRRIAWRAGMALLHKSREGFISGIQHGSWKA